MICTDGEAAVAEMMEAVRSGGRLEVVTDPVAMTTGFACGDRQWLFQRMMIASRRFESAFGRLINSQDGRELLAAMMNDHGHSWADRASCDLCLVRYVMES